MPHCFCIFELENDIPGQRNFLLQAQNKSIFGRFETIAVLLRIINEFLAALAHDLDIGLLELELASEFYAID